MWVSVRLCLSEALFDCLIRTISCFLVGVGRGECVPWRERGTNSQTWCHVYCTRHATKSKGLPPRKSLGISDLPPMAQSPKQLSRAWGWSVDLMKDAILGDRRLLASPPPPRAHTHTRTHVLPRHPKQLSHENSFHKPIPPNLPLTHLEKNQKKTCVFGHWCFYVTCGLGLITLEFCKCTHTQPELAIVSPMTYSPLQKKLMPEVYLTLFKCFVIPGFSFPMS